MGFSAMLAEEYILIAIIFISVGPNSIVLLFVIFISGNAFVLQFRADSHKIPTCTKPWPLYASINELPFNLKSLTAMKILKPKSINI